MKFIAVYVLICVVRLTMPGLPSRERNGIFLLRLASIAGGCAVGYGLIALSMHGYLVRGPEPALSISRLLIALITATGEYVTRRKLRRSNIFPATKRIPWTY